MSGNSISVGGAGASKALIRSSSKASPPPGMMSFGSGGDQEAQPLMASSRLQRVGAVLSGFPELQGSSFLGGGVVISGYLKL